jgi:hypothetical protein
MCEFWGLDDWGMRVDGTAGRLGCRLHDAYVPHALLAPVATAVVLPRFDGSSLSDAAGCLRGLVVVRVGWGSASKVSSPARRNEDDRTPAKFGRVSCRKVPPVFPAHEFLQISHSQKHSSA